MNPTDIFQASFLVDYLDDAPDVLAMADADSDVLSKRLRAMRLESDKASKLTYILGFHRADRHECFILEKRFVNWLYDEKRISMKPWIAIPGHIVVRSKALYDLVDPATLKNLPQRFS